jgi:endogenous inhibitor of DNA gyrase (YacG/DUF329 family)
VTKPRAGRCPVCGKPSLPQYRPFCSQRCKDIDLNRWLSDAYVIPGSKENRVSSEEDGREPSDESN